MGVYSYSALDQDGRTRKGLIDGDTERQVRDQLRAKGLIPLRLKPSVGRVRWRRLSSPALDAGDLAMCMRQLAILLRSGAALDSALHAVSRHTRRPKIASALLSVRDRILDGMSFASALDEQPGQMPNLYRAVIAAGERSGQLSEALEALSEHASRQLEFNRQLKLALLYPMIVSTVAIATMAALLTFVVPKLVELFEQQHQSLPVLTRAVIGLSEVLADWGWLVVLVVVGAGAVFSALPGDHRLRHSVARLLLGVPGVSYATRTVESVRFLRTLRLATGAALPLVDALPIAIEAVSNSSIREYLRRADVKLREGVAFHDALTEGDWLARAVVDLVSAGEQSGRLAEALDHAIAYQALELDSLVKIALGVVEPVLILVLGVAVLLIVFAVMAPIYQLNTLLG